MYCTLVFIYVILSMLSLVLFATITAPQWIGICVIAGLFLGMALVSYSAAIASAGGYCTALMEINEVKLEE
jgi:general stress protein CsbA